MTDKPYLTLGSVRRVPGEPRSRQAFAELSEAETWALAQLVKRLGFSDCRANGVDDEEAHLMNDAVAKVYRLLADVGIAPR